MPANTSFGADTLYKVSPWWEEGKQIIENIIVKGQVRG
jgi:hypothetical protein